MQIQRYTKFITHAGTVTCALCLSSCLSTMDDLDEDNAAGRPTESEGNVGQPTSGLTEPSGSTPEDRERNKNAGKPADTNPDHPADSDLETNDDYSGTLYGFEGGIAVIEAEDLTLEGGFAVIYDNSASDGKAIGWTESTTFHGNPQNADSITVGLKVETPGRYRLVWRNRIGQGNDTTEHNDSWLRFGDLDTFYGKRGSSDSESRRYPKPLCDNGSEIAAILALPQVTSARCPNGTTRDGWLKVYSSGATTWKWSTRTSDNDAHDIYVEFPTAGIHEMEIAVRSSHHLIDRIVLHRESISDSVARNLGRATTRLSGSSSPEPEPEPEPEPGSDGTTFKKWDLVELDWIGPTATEAQNTPNPFLDYRLQVNFTAPSGKRFNVPGFFDGNGNGGGSGSTWRVRFRPNETGTWRYEVDFRQGTGVALALNLNTGSTRAPHGTAGSFSVSSGNFPARDFRSRGFLRHTGGHYLKTEDGRIWIKGGADSPENFFGYAGFDNTVDQSGGAGTSGLVGGVHRYEPHISDWKAGDPDWGGGKGKGIIGALNYLASEEVNSIYFLLCNLGGDGRETYPYINPSDQLHWDISKLRQWEIVMAHAESLGIALHLVLNETESGNENLHDNGTLGTERKLYYRELIARFGHHLALFFNLSEENDFSPAKKAEFAAYIAAVDPYDHPMTVHSHPNRLDEAYADLLGNPDYDMTSIQFRSNNAERFTEEWRERSAAAGRRWVIMLDEVGSASTGVTDENAASMRRTVLWPALLSGAGGVEWYFGYHSLPLGGDMRTENFRTRSAIWQYTRVARHFIETLPLESMTLCDNRVQSNDQCFRKAGEVYALYRPSGDAPTLDLSGESGLFDITWHDVVTGASTGGGSVNGGSEVALGSSPYGGEAAAIIRKR